MVNAWSTAVFSLGVNPSYLWNVTFLLQFFLEFVQLIAEHDATILRCIDIPCKWRHLSLTNNCRFTRYHRYHYSSPDTQFWNFCVCGQTDRGDEEFMLSLPLRILVDIVCTSIVGPLNHILLIVFSFLLHACYMLCSLILLSVITEHFVTSTNHEAQTIFSLLSFPPH
jgi:hypothetical protein